MSDQSQARTLSYVEAIAEATAQEMARDSRVIVFGLDVDDHKAVQGTTRGLLERFGPERVFGTPLSEDAMTGAAVGMAMAGLRPIHVHIRMDFLMLAMNQLVNVAAKSHYMYGGQISIPLVVRSMIGKSWGQGAQHSQGLYSFFMHVPGLRVIAPTTPYDAKGGLIAAIHDDNPVMFVEHRTLHFQNGAVPEDLYTIPPGKGRVTQTGEDVTIVGISYMQVEALRAARYLADVGVSAEVIDPIWLAPLDVDLIAEIAAAVHEVVQDDVPLRVRRMGFAPTPCPPAPTLESLYYPSAQTIAAAARDLVAGETLGWLPDERSDLREIEFKGPF